MWNEEYGVCTGILLLLCDGGGGPFLSGRFWRKIDILIDLTDRFDI
jgi:hypothetical protein